MADKENCGNPFKGLGLMPNLNTPTRVTTPLRNLSNQQERGQRRIKPYSPITPVGKQGRVQIYRSPKDGVQLNALVYKKVQAILDEKTQAHKHELENKDKEILELKETCEKLQQELQDKVIEEVTNPVEVKVVEPDDEASLDDEIEDYVQSVLIKAQNELQREKATEIIQDSDGQHTVEEYRYWLTQCQVILRSQAAELKVYQRLSKQLEEDTAQQESTYAVIENVHVRLKEKAARLKEEKKHLDEQSAVLEAELSRQAELASKVQQLQQENEELRDNIKLLDKTQLIIDLEREIALKDKELSVQRQELEQLRERLDDDLRNQEELKELQSKLEDLQKSYEEKCEEFENFRKEQEFVEDRLALQIKGLQDTLDEKDTELKEYQGILETKDFLEEEKGLLTEDLEDAKSTMLTLRTELALAQEQCDQQEEMINKYRNQLEYQQEEIESTKSWAHVLLLQQGSEAAAAMQAASALSDRMRALLEDVQTRVQHWLPEQQGIEQETATEGALTTIKEEIFEESPAPAGSHSSNVCITTPKVKVERTETDAEKCDKYPDSNEDSGPNLVAPLVVKTPHGSRSFVCSVLRAAQGMVSNENSPVPAQDQSNNQSSTNSKTAVRDGNLSNEKDSVTAPVTDDDKCLDGTVLSHSAQHVVVETEGAVEVIATDENVTDDGMATSPESWPIAQPVFKMSSSTAFVRVLKSCAQSSDETGSPDQEAPAEPKPASSDAADSLLEAPELQRDDPPLNRCLDEIDMMLCQIVVCLKQIDQGARHHIYSLEQELESIIDEHQMATKEKEKQNRILNHENELLQKELLCVERIENSLKDEVSRKDVQLQEKELTIQELQDYVEQQSQQIEKLMALESIVVMLRQQNDEDKAKLIKAMELLDQHQKKPVVNQKKVSVLVEQNVQLEKQTVSLQEQLEKAERDAEHAFSQVVHRMEGELYMIQDKYDDMTKLLAKFRQAFESHRELMGSVPDLAKLSEELEGSAVKVPLMKWKSHHGLSRTPSNASQSSVRLNRTPSNASRSKVTQV